MDPVNVAAISYLVGVLLSIILPWLLANPRETFDWRYSVGRLIAAFLAGLAFVITPGFMDQARQVAVQYSGYLWMLAVFFLLMGIGISEAGRWGQKVSKQGP